MTDESQDVGFGVPAAVVYKLTDGWLLQTPVRTVACETTKALARKLVRTLDQATVPLGQQPLPLDAPAMTSGIPSVSLINWATLVGKLKDGSIDGQTFWALVRQTCPGVVMDAFLVEKVSAMAFGHEDRPPRSFVEYRERERVQPTRPLPGLEEQSEACSCDWELRAHDLESGAWRDAECPIHGHIASTHEGQDWYPEDDRDSDRDDAPHHWYPDRDDEPPTGVVRGGPLADFDELLPDDVPPRD